MRYIKTNTNNEIHKDEIHKDEIHKDKHKQ